MLVELKLLLLSCVHDEVPVGRMYSFCDPGTKVAAFVVDAEVSRV